MRYLAKPVANILVARLRNKLCSSSVMARHHHSRPRRNELSGRVLRVHSRTATAGSGRGGPRALITVLARHHTGGRNRADPRVRMTALGWHLGGHMVAVLVGMWTHSTAAQPTLAKHIGCGVVSSRSLYSLAANLDTWTRGTWTLDAALEARTPHGSASMGSASVSCSATVLAGTLGMPQGSMSPSWSDIRLAGAAGTPHGSASPSWSAMMLEGTAGMPQGSMSPS